MKCLDWKEKISGYVDREISPAEVREVEEHLGVCASCRKLERRMRAVSDGVARIEADVPSDFREKVFARLEAEELLPRRRSLFAYSLRWAAVPLAAAAALAVFMLGSPDKSMDPVALQGDPARLARQAPQPPAASPGVSAQPEAARPSVAPSVKGGPPAAVAVALSAEEREILAYLDVLEDPEDLEEQGDADEIEIFVSSARRRG